MNKSITEEPKEPYRMRNLCEDKILRYSGHGTRRDGGKIQKEEVSFLQ